jgi:2-oxoglutarate ferredoxin oxidoreductase subunit delta
VAKGRIVIDAERCKGCAFCLEFCPKHCIEMGQKPNAAGYFYPVFSDPEACTGCAVCREMCPDFAIEVYRK